MLQKLQSSITLEGFSAGFTIHFKRNWNRYLSHGRNSTNSPSVSSAVSEILTYKYPSLFSGPRDKEILNQCVAPAIPPMDFLTKTFSLTQRYHIMDYTSAGIVRVEKVKFGSQIACGLRAKVRIESFTAILSTCSSMSLDTVDGQRAISVINSSPRQKGPVGPRLILGPFRFANHDCDPNCQVSDQCYALHDPNLNFTYTLLRLCQSIEPMHTPSLLCAP